jgi:Amt family ammonium transporter
MPAALLIGALAGVIHNLAFEALLRWRIDDPVGAVPVHLACGVFGVIGVALFAPADALAHSRWTQLAIQLTGAVTCIAWAGLASFGLFALLRATTGLRVSAAEERSGLRLDGFVEPVDEDDDLDPSVLEGMLGLSSDQANG